jgi:hypothetical protein
MTFETLNLESLASKSAFLTLKFSVFGNLRKAHVQATTTANQKRFKHSKQLLESEELKAIGRADVAIKNVIAPYCLPSNIDSGLRSVPNLNVQKVVDLLDAYQTIDRPALVDIFLDVYEAQVAEAKLELKEHFNPGLYPSVEQMKEEFAFEYHFITFGQPPENLKAFAPALYEKEKNKAHKMVLDAAAEVAAAMRTAAAELVTKLADVLKPAEADGKPKKIFDAHIDNLKEFLNGFDIRNVTDDKALKTEMDKLKQLMNGVDAEKIRHNDGLKLTLSSQISDIAKSVGSMAEVKGRKFRETVETVDTPAEPVAA